MKNALIKSGLFLFLGFILLSFTWEKKGNSLSRENLKGRVKTIEEHCYVAKEKNGKPVKGKLYYAVFYKYDSLGNELLKAEFDPGGRDGNDTIKDTHYYKYDANGKIIEMYILPSFNADGSVKTDKGFATKSVNKYDDKGKLIEVYDYGFAITSLDFKVQYKYDDKGNMIEEDEYEKGEKFVEKILYKYDDKGNIVKTENCNPPDSISDMHTYEYDSIGNEIGNYIGFGKRGFERWTKKFDNEGNQVEMKLYSERSEIPRISTYSYVYDRTGNWVIEINFEKGEPEYITERVIEYY